MLAKNILRSARFVSSRQQSVRCVARVFAQQNSIMGMNTFRMFASNANIERSIQKLSKALEKEIKYENENYSQLEDIEVFLKESGFAFHEEDAGTVMTLSKTVGDKVIEIYFEAR